MPVGIITGLKADIRTGIRTTILGGIYAGGVDVDRDATSNIYVPGSTAQWAALGVAAPVSIWGMQDASGGAVDALATTNLTPTGSPSYQQAVAGWSRLAIVLSDGTSAKLESLGGAVPDIATVSGLILCYAVLNSTPATIRNVLQLGTTGRAAIESNATPRTVANSNGNLATGTVSPNSVVRPYLLKVDRTGAVMTVYTQAEKLTPTFAVTMTGVKLTLGSNGSRFAAPASHLYAAMWSGASAEMSDATARAMLQALGWTVAW